MVHHKIVKFLKSDGFKRKRSFLLATGFYLSISPISNLSFASDLKKTIKPINNQLINSFQEKNYLIKGKSTPTMTPLISGEIKTKSQLFNTRGYVKIKGPKINLIVKDADAKDLLLSLSNVGKYGLVFVPSPNEVQNTRLVTLSLQNVSYERAINSILLASSLQGKFEKGILIIGENILNKSFGPNISKVYRLNQISSESAAEYLGSLGATINILSLNSPIKLTTSNKISLQQDTKISKIESYGSSEGPLKGLIGTSDSRLQTITLIGDPKLISIADKYIEQLDRRQRQVALEVKILDITLKDGNVFDNSNFFRSKSLYIVNSNGIANIIYGKDVSNLTGIQSDILGTKNISGINDGEFLNWFNARIVSSKTNVIANPTLILSENKESISGGSTSTSSNLSTATIGRPFANESFITVGNKVITNYTVTQSESGGSPSCEAVFGTEGITFGAKVYKIDDNGYVTFSLSPELASVTDTILIPNCGIIKTLSVRRLDTGGVRVRDGQTLILSGVLSNTDTKRETKFPVLGYLPVIGNLFSSKSKSSDNSELVIMVSPKIINDENISN
ncbi:MAG: hypothetical protein CBD95_005155 [Flavobacteriales bacterium TMED235]|nr:MAG: hypothetical protein CBD95_005155 [Flavobacteriales bacterium TMED235]|tara:strand:+ start:2674 stop:4365 length:1692 start_codon:yes stop_codon:yes gene_type:complete